LWYPEHAWDKGGDHRQGFIADLFLTTKRLCVNLLYNSVNRKDLLTNGVVDETYKFHGTAHKCHCNNEFMDACQNMD